MQKDNYVDRRVSAIGAVTLVALLALALSYGAITSATATLQDFSPYPNGRFGFGLTISAGTARTHNMPGYLNAGWYWNWAANGETELPPLDYAQTVNLSPVKSGGVQIGYTASPTGTALLNAIAEQPGSIWIIGNEPDCTLMDDMYSSWYAYAYHDLYYRIKAADPTAKIAAGNIVQPTHQRFMYLDRVLAAYQQAYHEPLPADLWVIHSYILCEKCYPIPAPGEPFAWGACWVPDWPSYSASYNIGTFYSVYDHWDIDIFTQRIIDFRRWMYDNGYRNHPLLIAEYGILFYQGLVGGMTPQDDIDFMYAGFDWMQEARDATLGYAPDDDRLVQRWAWYSLAHGDYPGGSLFNDATYQPDYLGTAYHTYTAQVTPTVDLLLLDLQGTTPVDPPSGTFTATLSATLANAGNITTGTPVTVSFYLSAPTPIPLGDTTVGALRCCGDHEIVTAPSPSLPKGAYEFCATFTQSPTVSETACSSFGVDLRLDKVWAPTVFTSSTELVTATLYATVANYGDIGTWDPVTVTFYQTGGSSATIDAASVGALQCCGGPITTSVFWPDLPDGIHSFCVVAGAPHAETQPTCKYVWINPPYNIAFPLVLRAHQP